MKNLGVYCVGLALVASRLSAQDADPSLDGALVSCGQEKVVIFERTASKDHRYALAWTLRPNTGRLRERWHKPVAPPVDWTTYTREGVADWLAGYRYDEFVEPGENVAPYEAFEGIVDLRARRFTPLSGTTSYYPLDPFQHRLGVTWSDGQIGARYALVNADERPNNDEQWYTNNVWLLRLDSAQAPRVREISGQLSAVVMRFRRERFPAEGDSQGTVLFADSENIWIEGLPAVFSASKVSIRFRDVLSGPDDGYVGHGRITVFLKSGRAEGTSDRFVK